MTLPGNFSPFAQKMRAEGLPDIVIENFRYYYQQLVEGQSGLIPEADIEPVETLPDAEQFSAELADIGRSALPQTVFLKLNGGLGTSMGLEKAKSLLTIKNGMNFLDVIAQHVQKSGLPLVLMNSFNTHQDTLAALKKYPSLWTDIPLDFLQHKVPKVLQRDFSPAEWPPDPSLEWCPPGHGDIYTALVTSGMLSALLKAGYHTMFVSNVDNLGAVIDPALLGYVVKHNVLFMMEVADRTEADKKGGHLAKRPNGQLLLRESAQCPTADMAAFQDVTRHKYFNTNNLWIRLPALQQLLAAKNNILGLAMIRNAKNLDPRDKTSPPVYQLETAMGSAIAVFEGAQAVRVPKTRFAPIKKTNDLLDVRSDNYILTGTFQIVPNPKRPYGRIVINLDPAYYQLIDQLEARFPYGPPSLLECERLTVKGDIKFGRGVKLKGSVELINSTDRQLEIPNGAEISGKWPAD